MNKDIKQELTTIKNSFFITATYSCTVTATASVHSSIVVVDGLTLPTNKLATKNIYMTEGPPAVPPVEPVFGLIPEPGTYVIISHYSSAGKTYFTVQHSFVNTFTITCTVDDDILLFNKIGTIITYLGTATTSQFISNKMPTYNDYFVKFNELVEDFTSYTSNYINKDTVHTAVGNISTYLDLVVSEQTDTTAKMDIYLTNTQSKVTSINNILAENEAYFKKLKTLMADMKIADQKVNNEVYINYYDTRETTSKNTINELYNTFVSDGKVGYSNKIQEKLTSIKIV